MRFLATGLLSLVVLGGFLFAPAPIVAEQAYHARYRLDGNERATLIDAGLKSFALKGRRVVERTIPEAIVEHQPLQKQKVVDLFAASPQELETALAARALSLQQLPATSDPGRAKVDDEVVTLIDNGPSGNRIDLVFMGDGYTARERDKFFSDMERLVDEMFNGQTFQSYLPVFNVHLVFRPSAESGIGRNDRPRDTAYRLYRSGNTLRAIYPGNRSAIRNSCAQAPDCDYPIVIANDPFYGGLGGEIAISTSSITSGTVVLRHELGHNFGVVGEEYDGGGYFGANNSRSATNPSWRHWLSGPDAYAEPIVARHIAWPWRYLPNGSYQATWTSDGRGTGYQIRFSASGVETDGALQIELDGLTFAFTASGTEDRDFHTFYNMSSGFSAGRHSFVVAAAPGMDPWLSSISIFEFGAGFHHQDGFVNAYPVYTNPGGRPTGYRPTFETCLMRNMKSERFCVVCQENNWLKFFDRIDMIDDVVVASAPSQVDVEVVTPTLGQRRAVPLVPGEVLEVTWTQDGVVRGDLQNQLQWSGDPASARGRWHVHVKLVTPEVRRDARGVLEAAEDFSI